jgi:FkbM family methyltransferase
MRWIHLIRRKLVAVATGTRLEPLSRYLYSQLGGKAARSERAFGVLAEKVLSERSSCVDVGSYRGQLLRIMLKNAPSGHHVAFEPVPENCLYLRQRFPTVDVRQCAVGERSGRVAFQLVRGRPARSGLRRVPYPDEAERVDEIEVELTTLDHALRGIEQLDLIKIDVEGGELAVLKGGAEVLRSFEPPVVFEFSRETARVYGTSAGMIYEFFEDRGYSLLPLSGFWTRQSCLSLSDFEGIAVSGQEVDYLAIPGRMGLLEKGSERTRRKTAAATAQRVAGKPKNS